MELDDDDDEKVGGVWVCVCAGYSSFLCARALLTDLTGELTEGLYVCIVHLVSESMQVKVCATGIAACNGSCSCAAQWCGLKQAGGVVCSLGERCRVRGSFPMCRCPCIRARTQRHVRTHRVSLNGLWRARSGCCTVRALTQGIHVYMYVILYSDFVGFFNSAKEGVVANHVVPDAADNVMSEAKAADHAAQVLPTEGQLESPMQGGVAQAMVEGSGGAEGVKLALKAKYEALLNQRKTDGGEDVTQDDDSKQRLYSLGLWRPNPSEPTECVDRNHQRALKQAKETAAKAKAKAKAKVSCQDKKASEANEENEEKSPAEPKAPKKPKRKAKSQPTPAEAAAHDECVAGGDMGSGSAGPSDPSDEAAPAVRPDAAETTSKAVAVGGGGGEPGGVHGEKTRKRKKPDDEGYVPSFARRTCPTQKPYATARWHAIRDAFIMILRPHLRSPSSHEDPLCWCVRVCVCV